MNNKYRFKYNNKINLTIIAVTLICLIGIICDAVFLAFAVRDKLNISAYITSLTLLVILLAFIPIFIFGSYYNINKDKFIISMCFYKKKIDYQDILNIRHDSKTKQTIVYYYTYNKKGEQLVAMLYLNMNEKDLDNFVKDIKEKNNLIIYDIWNKEEDNAENQWTNNRKQ